MTPRPFYEKSEDRARELEAVQKIARPDDVVRKLPIRYGVDFLLFRNNEPHSWVEVKCRKNERDKYPDLMISVAKIVEGIQLSKMTGLPFILVVDWTDCIGAQRIYNTDSMEMRWGGRDDRGDEQDMEPVYHLNVNHFATRFRKK